jgi:hypothetical protein
MNNAGSSVPTSLRGNVLGLDLYVDPNAVSTTIDESAFIVVPSSVSIYESTDPTPKHKYPNFRRDRNITIWLYGRWCIGRWWRTPFQPNLIS